MIYTMRDNRSKHILSIMCRDLNSKEKTMVEIGSYTGESTAIFAKNFKTVYAIDPWLSGMYLTEGAKESAEKEKVYMDEAVEKEFDKVASVFSNIVKIKDYDYNAWSKFTDESLDFVYIDGIHTEAEVTRQILAWVQKLNFTGVIGGHDYNDNFPGVIQAVKQTVGLPDKLYLEAGISWSKYKNVCWL